MAGGSYTDCSRISVFTGNPTVLGWHGHEWIWRSDENYQAPEEEQNRWQDIYSIYMLKNEELARNLIKKYNISYIYIGNVELQEYKNLDIDFLLGLGDVVFEISEESCQKSPVYIIDVRN